MSSKYLIIVANYYKVLLLINQSLRWSKYIVKVNDKRITEKSNNSNKKKKLQKTSGKGHSQKT